MTVAPGTEWDHVESAFEAWVRSVLGYGVGVCWKDRSSREGVTVPFVELAIWAETPRGTDDVEYDENNIPRITSLWEFSLSVTGRSREQTPLRSIRNHLTRLAASLQHETYIEALRLSGVTFLRGEPLRTLSYTENDRRESAAVLDLRFSVVTEFYEPAGPAVDMAETATVLVTEATASPVLVSLPPEN